MQSVDGFAKDIKSAWLGLALILAVFVLALRCFAPRFAHNLDLIDMPIAEFVTAYCVIALAFILIVPSLVRATQMKSHGPLLIVLVTGLILRVGLLGTPTILEDDYNRYLWDAAVTANAENPYIYSPEQIVETANADEVLNRLKKDAGPVFDRINYPEFSTIYPPVAQAILALTYKISPFDLNAFRLILLAFEVGCAVLILAILRHLNKSPLWLAVYWWNPLVLKEVANSAHMEPFLMLPVLMACFLALKGRLISSSAMLAVAAGVKIWPVLLVAPLWRQMLAAPKQLFLSGIIFISILAIMILPVLLAGLKSHSGFVAFGGQWEASSAAYLVAQRFSDWVWPYWLDTYLEIPQVARLMLVLILICFMGLICLRAANGNVEILNRMFLVTVAIFLLSPSNAPWYFIWIAPFLCFFPSYGLMLAGALIPLHYSFFHLTTRGMADIYHEGVVWLIWIPVWGLMVLEFLANHRTSRSREISI